MNFFEMPVVENDREGNPVAGLPSKEVVEGS